MYIDDDDDDDDNKNNINGCEVLRFCCKLAEQVNTSTCCFLFFFSCSCPDCIDSQSRCSVSRLCILLQVQVSSVTGKSSNQSL